MSFRFIITACEPSADHMGAGIIQALKAQRQETISFVGCGGEEMEQQGLRCLIPPEIALQIGAGDIFHPLLSLKLRPHIRKFRQNLLTHLRQNAVDAVIAIDAPGFALANLRLLRSHKFLVPHILINPPPVWAFARFRVRSYAQNFALLCCLLPFEEPYFNAHGGNCRFIGFPAAMPPSVPLAQIEQFARRLDLQKEQTVLAYLPGSRRREIEILLPIFAKTHQLLSSNKAYIRPVIVSTPLLYPLMQALVARYWTFDATPPTIIHHNERHALFARANAALVASGTASLEVAAAELPCVITYKIEPFIGSLLEYLAPLFVHTTSVGLVNIFAHVKQKPPPIPEYLQSQAKPALLAKQLQQLIGTNRGSLQVQQVQPLLKEFTLPNNIHPFSHGASQIYQLLSKMKSACHH